MKNDFCALCAELLREFSSLYSDMSAQVDFNDAYLERTDALITRARAALAEPVGKVPTDQELDRLLYYEFTTSTGHGERQDAMGFARAVLARWGRPIPQPIPVSEAAPPAGGLVERVATAIAAEPFLSSPTPVRKARAAIREVAAWLEGKSCITGVESEGDALEMAAQILNREANR